MYDNTLKTSVCSITLLLASQSANALLIYTDAAAYDSAVTTTITEDFESYAVSGTTGGGALTLIDFDHFSASSSPDAVKVLDVTWAFSQNTTAGGSQYLYLDTDLGLTGSVTSLFNFDSAITSIGFNYSYNPSWAPENLEVTIGSDSFILGDVNSAGIGFWGITTDTSFTSLSINSGLISGYGIDDVRLSSASASVDEPSVLLLLCIGLLGLGFQNRKVT